MTTRNRIVLVVGLLGAVVVLGGLVLVVGGRRILTALATADPTFVVAVLAFAFGWLIAWSLMLRTILAGLDVHLTVWRSFLVTTSAIFANNVTPFGQAGGEPITAYVISNTADVEYETGLVSIASFDATNVVPSVSLAVVGVAAYASTATVNARLRNSLALAIALLVGVALVAVLTWRLRARLVAWLPALVATPVVWIGRGRFDDRAIETEFASRLRGVFENVERVGADRTRLTAVVGFSTTGWLLQSAALLAAFAALGYEVSLPVALFAVPLAYLGGATPLPGGLGSIEAAFVALLVPTTGIPAPTVTAAVLVFRGAVYWTPVVVGGAAMASLGTRAAW
jgi:hypothetical protein